MSHTNSLSGSKVNSIATNRDHIMARSVLALFLLIVLSVGCSTTHEVGDLRGEMSIYRAATRLRGEEVTLVTLDGQQEEGTVRTLGRHGLSFTPEGVDSVRTIPLGTIRSIEKSSPEVFAGAGVGGLAGCIIGVAATPRPDEDLWFGDLAYAGNAGIGMLAGCGVGILVGATRSESYVFTSGSNVSVGSTFTVKLTSFVDEVPDAVCIMWNGKRLWLPKSEVTIERDGEYILLTVPEKLLEPD